MGVIVPGAAWGGHGCGEPRSTGESCPYSSRVAATEEVFVELLAPGALAPLDVAILLFGTAWLDDLHGNVEFLEKFLEDTAELGTVVGLAPRGMRAGKVSRMRSKAARMLHAERGLRISTATSFEIRTGRLSADRSSNRRGCAETGCPPATSFRIGAVGVFQ